MHFELINHMEERRVGGIGYAKENPVRKMMQMLLDFLKTTRSSKYSYRGIVDSLYFTYQRDNYTEKDCELLLNKFNYSAKLLTTGELVDDEDFKIIFKVLCELFNPLSKLYHEEEYKISAVVSQENSLDYVLPPMKNEKEVSSKNHSVIYSSVISVASYIVIDERSVEKYFEDLGWKISRNGKRQVDLYMTDLQLLCAITYLKENIY